MQLPQRVFFFRRQASVFLSFATLFLVLACTPKEPVSLIKNLSLKEQQTVTHNLYLLRCSSCHGVFGEGNIGPNLSDSYWLYGDGSLASIESMISDGSVKKGMPAWKHVFSKEDIAALAVFVKSLKGTEPLNQKAPQGTKIDSKK